MIQCDIIIPIHNNREDTENCLGWLARNTESVYRLILVDDASGHETAAWLVAAAGEHRFGPTLLLRNERNLGWTGATNRGLEASDAPFLCLMNNDTLACPGWLGALKTKIETAPGLGLIQPMGNDRAVRQEAERDLLGFSARLARANAGLYRRISYISGFCLMMPRSLYEDLGPFDPVFPQGLWADHDYLRRAQDRGWFAAEAMDGFVYHLESRTLAVKVPGVKERARAGEKIFIQRWGYKRKVMWIPPGPLDGRRPGACDDLLALQAQADRGHDIYVPLLNGESPGAVLLAHGLTEHSNLHLEPCPLPPPLRGLWLWWRYGYLRYKKRVNERLEGTAASLNLFSLPPEDMADQDVGVRYRGK